MALLPAYRLKLYRNFKAIEISDFHGVVRYYERFEEDIQALDFDEYFDCTVAYTHALFEIGEYGKHLVMNDHLLETVIMQNIDSWGGEDLYTKLLFQRAEAFYHAGDFSQSEHVLRELVKLDPWRPAPIKFLQKCLLKQRPTWMPKAVAFAVLLVLLSAAVIALEIFVLRPFHPDLFDHAQWLHSALFLLGVFLLAGSEGWHALNCQQVAHQFAVKWRLKKRLL